MWVAIFGAFHPNYFSRSMPFIGPDQKDNVERDDVKTLSGYDPYSTIRLNLKYFSSNQPIKAYVAQIKENLREMLGNFLFLVIIRSHCWIVMKSRLFIFVDLLEEDSWDADILADGWRIFI